MLRSLLNTARFICNHPLTRQHRTAALARYLWWQARQRCTSKPAAVAFVNGSRVLIPPHAHGLTGYLYVGLPDFEEAAFVLHLLRTDDGFADVGANAGAWTVLAGGGVGARVDSFEPLPEARGQLEANVAINALKDSVRIHAVGVGSAPGRLRFTTGDGTANRVVVAGTNEHCPIVELPVTTLDTIYAEYYPTVIKIDVEGWELEVIRGARKVLASPGLFGLVIETFRRANLDNPKLQEMEAILAGHGFLPRIYDPFTRRLYPLEDSNDSSDNTIYARSTSVVAQRLAEAASFRVLGQSV